MKFTVPRSLSPSPERVVVRPDPASRAIYGLRDTDLYDFDDDSSDDGPLDGDDSDSDPVNTYIPDPNGRPRTLEQQQEIVESLTAIRRRVKYVDPYEEWHRKAREEAYRDGRKRHSERLAQQEAARLRLLNQNLSTQSLVQKQQIEEVSALLENIKLQWNRETENLKKEFEKRDRALWTNVEKVIQDEERKIVLKRAEEERERREELERVQREERQRREAQERKEQEERERKLREELERKKKEKEEHERQEREEKQLKEAEEQGKRMAEMQQLGLKPASEEWKLGRATLARLKTEVHPAIKADRELKTLRNKLRRQITPKIGQLTADPEQINRVIRELQAIFQPSPSHPPLIYVGLLSALAKAFILQAETEVTAKSDAALPLAKVLVALLSTLPGLAEILYARLVQRIGVWAVPHAVLMSGELSKEEKESIQGVRREDTDVERRTTRIGGVMTLIFCVMHTPHPQPLPEMFRLGRFWTYIARLVNSQELCRSNIALEVIRVALAVAGDQAIRVWGKQWVKMLYLIQKRVDGAEAGVPLIGEEGVAGTAKRVRVREEVRKMLG